MKGLSVQPVENSSADRSDNRIILFCFGMLLVYGIRDVWAHKNGRYKTSENKPSQDTLAKLFFDSPAYEQCQVPSQVKGEGGHLHILLSQGLVAAVKKKKYSCAARC
jgi:hypothetical protein